MNNKKVNFKPVKYGVSEKVSEEIKKVSEENEKFIKIKYAIIDKLMNNVDGFIWAGLYKKNYKASDKEIGTIYGKKLFIKRDEK